jgi:glycosyltransferase involved in cell wall biosynthesis
MKHILIIASFGPSLINFRFDLIKKILSKGHKVSVATPKNSFPYNLQKKLMDLGIQINFFSLSRANISLLKDIKSLNEIYKIIKNLQPNIIISYTAKPIIYTGISLKLLPKINFYPLITGLGSTFTEINSIRSFFLKIVMICLYKLSLKSSAKIIFQNIDDQSLFLKLKIINQKKLSCIVNGSGVNLNTYPLTKLPTKIVFLMMARLLIAKGVRDYVEAAKIVKASFSDAKFQLAGKLEKNFLSINRNELNSWVNQGVIEYLGEVKSVKSILKSCRFFILPSYYREGIPRSILEALSTGRPVITTDAPGCRETVTHKKNGLLVHPKDPIALADAMIKLIKEKDKVIKKMAKESYLKAKKKFDVKKINNNMLKIMNM